MSTIMKKYNSWIKQSTNKIELQQIISLAAYDKQLTTLQFNDILTTINNRLSQEV